MSNRKMDSLIAALGAVLGNPQSPEEIYLSTKPFQGDAETESAYFKAIGELSKISPTDVDSFMITVVARRPKKEGEAPTPCPGCGGFHESESMYQFASVAGDGTAIMAQIILASDGAGLT